MYSSKKVINAVDESHPSIKEYNNVKELINLEKQIFQILKSKQKRIEHTHIIKLNIL